MIFSSEAHWARRRGCNPSPVIVLIALSITLLATDCNIRIRFPIWIRLIFLDTTFGPALVRSSVGRPLGVSIRT